VRTAAEFELQRNVIISGEVRYPGQYTLIDKRERVLSLIQRAGGPTYAAFLEGAYMVRKEDNQGRILLNAQKVLEDPNSNYNYILHKGDSIFIPKMKDLVTIKGAVNYPPIDSGYIDKIAVPFHEGKNALFYVQNYGAGVSRYKNGKKNLIYVTYPSGQIRKTKVFLGIFRKYPKVEKGSIVSVETKKRKKKEASASKGSNFDWQKFWATTMAQVSAALTLYLLMKTAFSR
jgi:hypothetical protein